MCDDDVAALVVDNGSGMCKAGKYKTNSFKVIENSIEIERQFGKLNY